jgi:hypothetical protein
MTRDIEMTVDKITTYLVLGDKSRTLLDRTGERINRIICKQYQ